MGVASFRIAACYYSRVSGYMSAHLAHVKIRSWKHVARFRIYKGKLTQGWSFPPRAKKKNSFHRCNLPNITVCKIAVGNFRQKTLEIHNSPHIPTTKHTQCFWFFARLDRLFDRKLQIDTCLLSKLTVDLTGKNSPENPSNHNHTQSRHIWRKFRTAILQTVITRVTHLRFIEV